MLKAYSIKESNIALIYKEQEVVESYGRIHHEGTWHVNDHDLHRLPLLDKGFINPTQGILNYINNFIKIYYKQNHFLIYFIFMGVPSKKLSLQYIDYC